ncbi:hypothetical protein Rhe02_38870 [Rhizocola hellebori]|uniref:Uncharacterized protein n=1 Tax=Rhizocola hellebori TaxID=1392758 RepID=A0A8J3Q8H5_9ACTN|nr:hypothetical protein Rhe02_38870 [Rhizocola hellebori]
MYDVNGTPVPTATLPADVLASMPSTIKALHADHQAAAKALHDADAALYDAREAEAAHRAEVYSASRDGRKAPASVAPAAFAGRIVAAEAKCNGAHRAARAAATAIDKALSMAAESGKDAPGHVARRLLTAQLAAAIANEREAWPQARQRPPSGPACCKQFGSWTSSARWAQRPSRPQPFALPRRQPRNASYTVWPSAIRTGF